MAFIIKERAHSFDVFDGDRLFTSVVYEPDFVRPFMGPVYTSFGDSFTRFEPFHREHPHQRSVFVGIGDVNGVDFWNEVGENKGKMVLDSILRAEGGEKATISVKLIWKTIDSERPLVDEIRTICFEKTADCIAVSLHLKFIAAYGDVTFGETKEAGPLGIRVADALRVDDGNGTFVNSEGGINEEQCWGKVAKWCNYYGTLSGRIVGIAAYDRKNNPRYPTAWHIRDYGLMAANNLFFKGPEHISAGETLEYDYLICFWEDSFDPKQYED